MRVISKFIGILVVAAIGYWCIFFSMAYISEIIPNTFPNPFKIGACLADQYSISCTGAIMKTDLQLPVLFKDQERLPQ